MVSAVHLDAASRGVVFCTLQRGCTWLVQFILSHPA